MADPQFGTTPGASFGSRMNTTYAYYENDSRNDAVYSEFEGVQDLSYSAQCLQSQNSAQEDQDVACMDLSLLLSSSKVCDRQQIEEEIPLNLTGKAREEEINRRLRQQQQQFNYSYPYSDPPRSSQVFVAPDFLGMHELQDLRTHIYIDEATSLNLSYCPQTLDLSAQSLDLSLSGQDLTYNDATVNLSAPHSLNLENYANCDVLNLTCSGGNGSASSNVMDFGIQDFQQPLPPASSLPLPFSISQTLTSTSCNPTQYTALDLQKSSSSCTPVEEKKYTCAQCGECFATVQELAAHRESHILSKPFICDQCDLRFMKAGTLNRHQKTTHANSRPFQCQVCRKKFAQRHDLHRHEQIHRRTDGKNEVRFTPP